MSSYDFDNFRAKTDGASVVLDARNFGGSEDVKMTFAPDFSVEIVYLNEPPANFRWAVDGWMNSIASEARKNALAEGLAFDVAWDDYFEERQHQRVRHAAQEMRKGREWKKR